MNRHVLVRRETVVQDHRHSTDCVCIAGDTGHFDQRHSNHRVLPLKLRPLEGEKIFLLQLDLLYCTNDTDREWRLELRGLWDGQDAAKPIQILIPPRDQTRGPVPSKDQCIYKPPLVSKWPDFLNWVGQEHALLNVHSSHAGPNKAQPMDGQLFEESDPFLQFTRQHWSLFSGLSEYDVVIVSEPKDTQRGIVYRISQHAIQRITHYMKTLFSEVRYKTRDPWLDLQIDPLSLIGNTVDSKEGGGFSGLVVMLQAKYLVISPAVPQCRVIEQPLII